MMFKCCCFVSAAMLFLAGCGGGSSGPTGTINGKLTLKGKPVAQGTIVSFLSEKGAVSGTTGSDGTFTVMGAPVGRYAVSVTASPSATSDLQDPAKAMKESLKGGVVGANTSIPEKFTAPDKSGISFEVKEGTNDFTLDMK